MPLGATILKLHSVPDSPANDAPHRLIHNCVFGDGATIASFTNLYGCAIGAGSRVGPFVEIQAGAVVGERCKIQSHSFICAGVRIGDGVFIGHGVIFVNDKVPRATRADGQLQVAEDWEHLDVRVESGATIGSGAIILGGVTVGADALVGAGAVVATSVATGAVVAGVPARAGHRPATR